MARARWRCSRSRRRTRRPRQRVSGRNAPCCSRRFNSEERGPLMGSWGYTEAPAVPLDRTVAMINMDMIGRNEEVPENGGARFRGLPVQTVRREREHGDAAGLEQEHAHVGGRASERGATSSRSRRTTTTTRRSCSDAATAGRFSSTACRRSGSTRGCIPTTTSRRTRPIESTTPKMERIAKLVHQVTWDLARSSNRPTLTKPVRQSTR